ncbi:FecR family protein [Massilia genomosp. 1]|uniref:Iron dicitrate transport regulator FecR n=1 Tax=Massilia genomosp. 1 TaxID=2609280 RepID=A0ABX0MKT3_9BURK|nr:FecR family protein [Massilia genomosp. 1]NHZ62667.1 iron dicitrate transport regulator FecR [Massilia genomosp. 1]
MGTAAWAGQVAGTVIKLSGPLMVKKADGAVKVLAVRSEVESGDTLMSQKNTYAQIRFIDNSEMTLRPDTTFVIEAFAYDGAKPEADSASFSLVQGGLRSLTGLLGKRNKEKFSLKTPAATIGIRGTTFVAQYVAPGVPPKGAPSTGQPPGLYLSVLDGAIIVSNKGGSSNFSAGQFGFTPSLTVTPVLVPVSPAIRFSPPPSFSVSQAPGANGASKGATQGVDCEVR